MAEFVALADLLRAVDGSVGVAVDVASALRTPPLDRASAASAQVVATDPASDAAPHATTGDNGKADFTVRVDRDRGGAVVAIDDVPQPDAVAAGREARLFRARLGDAFDAALARMLRELAADVLARELRLAPCDMAELARRALERAPVVRVRLAPADAERGLQIEPAGNVAMPVVLDASLQPGDAVFELAGGSLDARLGVRLAALLDANAGDIWSTPRPGR